MKVATQRTASCSLLGYVWLHTHAQGHGNPLIINHFSVFQAGDLYEKIRNNERALDYYCKGGAFRKGR